MNPVASALSALATTLDALDRCWALIGGLAVSCHVDPRFTRDVDVAIAVTDDSDAEALVHALASSGYRVSAAIEQDAVGRLATVRLVGAQQDVVLDLMFASSGIEPEICAGAMRIEALPGLTVPVASRAHLVAMKVLSVDDTRLQDALDLRALLAGTTDADLQDVETAIALIAHRGYHRGRDLGARLRQFLEGRDTGHERPRTSR